MAFDLEIFNKQVYTAMTETVDQDIAKFNEASNGVIQLINEPASGDFSIRASFKQISKSKAILLFPISYLNFLNMQSSECKTEAQKIAYLESLNN